MKVAIIGGSGKMGQWSANFLLQDGHQVVIIGRNQERLSAVKRALGVEIATNAGVIQTADVVLLSIPLDSYDSVAEEIKPFIRPQQIVVEIASLKAVPLDIMHKHLRAGLILGVHPMFGPGAGSVANQNFILTPTNAEETALAHKVRDYLEKRAARVTLMTPQEHDKMMSVILGLPHFIAIISANTLLNLGSLKQMTAIGGTTYQLLLTLVGSVLSEDSEFYASLQMNLPDMAQVEKLFYENSQIWTEMVANQDRPQFIKRLNLLKDRLKEENLDVGKAYQKMYQILKSL